MGVRVRGLEGVSASCAAPFIGDSTLPTCYHADMALSALLRCTRCSWTETCGPEGITAWLGKARRLRGGRPLEADVALEVLGGAAGELECPGCGAVGLIVQPAIEDDWPEARRCAFCNKPIPPERLEALPEADCCAACQQRAERGEAPTEVEYCPKCGAPLALRLSRSAGLTRYVRACTNVPPCRL